MEKTTIHAVQFSPLVIHLLAFKMFLQHFREENSCRKKENSISVIIELDFNLHFYTIATL